MSAVCPACGVALVPGYVRCPRCHADLPLGAGRGRRSTVDPGGTAVADRRFPLAPVLVALGVAAAIFAVFGLRGSGKPIAAAIAAQPAPIEAVPPPAVPRGAAPVAIASPASSPGEAGALDPRAAVIELESALRIQRLWGRSEITGSRIDLRSGSCGDPAMRPLVAGKASVLRGAGLTRLRCVEQSGAVVFEHDL